MAEKLLFHRQHFRCAAAWNFVRSVPHATVAQFPNLNFAPRGLWAVHQIPVGNTAYTGYWTFESVFLLTI